MRLSLLLVLGGLSLVTQQASGQSDFHTVWGRHLGWGVGPGYHVYSRDGIHTCNGGAGGPECAACSGAWPSATGDYQQEGSAILDYGTSQPTYTTQPTHQMMPQAPIYRTPTAPQLAPPQQQRPTPAPAMQPLPAPRASAARGHGPPRRQPAYHVPRMRPPVAYMPAHPNRANQFPGYQASGYQASGYQLPPQQPPAHRMPAYQRQVPGPRVPQQQLQSAAYRVQNSAAQPPAAGWSPPANRVPAPHLINPLITPTGPAASNPPPPARPPYLRQ